MPTPAFSASEIGNWISASGKAPHGAGAGPAARLLAAVSPAPSLRALGFCNRIDPVLQSARKGSCKRLHCIVLALDDLVRSQRRCKMTYIKVR